MLIAFPLDEVGATLAGLATSRRKAGAPVALLGPAVWLAPLSLFNSSGNQIDSAALVAALCSVDPQLDIPSWFSDHRLTREELKPAKHGLVSPSWIMARRHSRPALPRPSREARLEHTFPRRRWDAV
ncbi:MAG: hypothetical protein IPQ07_26410 [Myxococcales bacterium]|nr:hypothetical protein [Myxococcales bacterium]